MEVQTEHENGSVTEVDYVLKRLVHGMGSSRANSRNGFFSVLVALLSTVKSMKVTDILNSVKKHLCIKSNITKTEEAEIYTGQILVFGALIRSGQFVSKATVEEQHEVLSSLLIAGQQRSYLPIAAYTFLEELLLQSVVQSPAESQSGSASADDDFTIVSCHKNNSANSNGSKDLPVQRSGGRKSLTGNKTAIDLQTQISNSFHIHHPVYKEFAEQLATSPLLPDFWSQGVEPLLAKPNKNRDLLIIHIFQLVIANLTDKTQISMMLSANFLSMMMKHLTINTSPKPELTIEANKALRLVTDTFTEDMQDNDEVILEILRKFLFYPGTRTVQILSNKLKASGVKELATLYQNVVTCKMDKVTGLQGETELWHTAERKYAGELLTKLISNAPAVQDDHEWKLDMMKFFLELGMFHPINKDENNVVSHLLAGSLKNNFFRLFDQHPKLALPRLNNLCNTQSAIIHHLDSLLKNKKWVQRLRKPWSPEAKASLQKMIAVTKELELPKKGLPQSTVLIFRTMLMQMGIHLFVNPDLAIEVLEELHSCLNEIDTGNRKFDETSMEKEVQWVDVVVDLMLSLLSVNNHTLRIMINWVFPHLCPFLTPLALKQIIQESLDLDDMDPEEGQRINKELAQAFKKYKSATNNRKSKKMPRKDKALSHFRVRVLDLIEIYISSEPSLESCLDLIMPLFHLLEYCIPNIHQKPLESRVRTCISKLTGLKKFEVGKVTQEQLAELASELLSKGERTSVVFFDMNHKIAECVCFLVKASKHIPTPVTVPPIQWKMMKKIEVSPLTDVLRNALLDYFQNRIVDQVFKGKPKDQVQDNNADQESVIESTSAQVQDNNADQKCVIESTTGQVQHDTADQNSIIESATAHPQTNGIGELFGQQDNTVKIKRLKSKAKNNTLKKESTKLRADAMSVGLQSIDFKGVYYAPATLPRWVSHHTGSNSPQIGESPRGGGHPPHWHLGRCPTRDFAPLTTHNITISEVLILPSEDAVILHSLVDIKVPSTITCPSSSPSLSESRVSINSLADSSQFDVNPPPGFLTVEVDGGLTFPVAIWNGIPHALLLNSSCTYSSQLSLFAATRAHEALAECESRLKREGKNFLLITQNIDGLHLKAGSQEVLELHGSLFKTRCLKCGRVAENRDSPICHALKEKGAPEPEVKDSCVSVEDLPHCSETNCHGLLRPHVVWFGEGLDQKILIKAGKALENCDLCLVIGTSSVIYPAAMFAPQVAARGIPVAEFNIEATPATYDFKFHFEGPCGSTVPEALSL
uniref:Deacetylase sirtuin-type domain-containing protein n=2 Tax=Timema TaxID=61471 RepID=A0A7R8Z2X6_TIMDO|nr:unnamed protein product [Timema douglasi]